MVVEEACPKITLKGLKFLYPYRDWKFILPTILAVGELAVIIVQTVVGTLVIIRSITLMIVMASRNLSRPSIFFTSKS